MEELQRRLRPIKASYIGQVEEEEEDDEHSGVRDDAETNEENGL